MSEMGINYDFVLYNKLPSEEQLAMCAVLIHILRPRRFEHVIFSLRKQVRPDGTLLDFYQLYTCEDGSRHVEIGLITPSGRKQYEKECSAEEAIRLMHEVIRTSRCPDLAEWKDITDEIFPNGQAQKTVSGAINLKKTDAESIGFAVFPQEIPPPEDQLALCTALLRSLPPLSNEYLFLDFSNEAKGKYVSSGLSWLRLEARGGQLLCCRICVATDQGLKKFERECGLEEAARLLHDAFCTRQTPPLAGWKQAAVSHKKGGT